MKSRKVQLKSKAEQLFAANDKKTRLFLEDKEEAERKRLQKMARLKALRTASEATANK